MKKALFNIVALFSIAITITSCSKERKVEICDAGGFHHTATVAPCMENDLPDTGQIIPIMEPLGLIPSTDGYIYNSNYWKMQDTTAWCGTIERSIIFGKVVSID